jgi:hypothetical protein
MNAAGEEFLARTGVTDEEDGGTGAVGDHLRMLDRAPQCRAASDQGVEPGARCSTGGLNSEARF